MRRPCLSKGSSCVADIAHRPCIGAHHFSALHAGTRMCERQPRYPCRALARTTEDRRLCVAIFRLLCPCSTMEIVRAPDVITYRTSPHRGRADGGKKVKANRQARSGEGVGVIGDTGDVSDEGDGSKQAVSANSCPHHLYHLHHLITRVARLLRQHIPSLSNQPRACGDEVQVE
jgi:hypothetical protein